jgi:hypothetical protein
MVNAPSPAVRPRPSWAQPPTQLFVAEAPPLRDPKLVKVAARARLTDAVSISSE